MIQLIPRARQKTAKWSGGETSELFIYPPQASLTAQDFLFRISTASVACGASDFTLFPQKQRILLLLEGDITLTFRGGESIRLTPMQSAAFSGTWHTLSRGTGVNFNLIFSPSAKGFLKAIKLRPEKAWQFSPQSRFTGLYFPSGSAHVTAGDSSYSIEKNDFLLISNPAEGMIIHVDTLCEQYLIMTGVELDDK